MPPLEQDMEKRFGEKFADIDGIGGSHGKWEQATFYPYSLLVKSFIKSELSNQRKSIVERIKEIRNSHDMTEKIIGLESDDSMWHSGFISALSDAVKLIQDEQL